MQRLLRIVVWLALLSSLAAPAAAAQAAPLSAAPVPGPCQLGALPPGSLTLVCIPKSGWNGDLVVFAHGYVAFNQPLGFANLTLPDGTSLPTLAQQLGFAFATTSYRENGLAVLTGADDIRALTLAFRAVYGAPRHTYLVGGSEGGLVTTLLLEQSPQLYSGALAACGPIGSFRGQLDYIGDFRALFDVFFPGVLPGSPVAIPTNAMANWDSVYVPAITRAVTANPNAARQLIATSGAAVDPADPTTVLQTTLGLLWYNVFATDDAVAKLGGNPYDNRDRWYTGSDNDLLLNALVRRYAASPTALANLAPYETSGNLTAPLVTLHTTGDDIIPFWHELLYRAKAKPSGRGSLLQIPSFHYGHCTFTGQEMVTAFALLVLQVTSQPLAGAPAVSAEQARRDFARAAQQAAAQR